MAQEKFDRQLRLMVLLAGNTDYTIEDLAHQTGMSRRTIYRYIDTFKDLGFEVKTQQNKTFKVSRAKSVEVLDLKWVHKREHLPFFTDLFHFSGERRTRVRLLLGHLSASLLREESPFSEQQMIVQPDGRYLLDTQVCSYKGVGRFVLGLYDDIEIFRSPGFKHYIENQLSGMLEKFSPHKKKH